MAKEALMQVRMDSEVKEAAEKLYRSLGTSFAEAIRVFAVQSIAHQGYPFVPTAHAAKGQRSLGLLNRYADPKLRKTEKNAFKDAMEMRYGNDSRR